MKMMRKGVLSHKGQFDSLYIYIKFHRQRTEETAGTEKHAMQQEGHVNHGGEPAYQ